MSFSKPVLPLGIERIEGKRTPVVYADAEPETGCPICLRSSLPWCGFIDLKCGHCVCTSCLLYTHYVSLRDRGSAVDFLCPLCRRSHKVTAMILDQDEQVRGMESAGGIKIMLAVEDVFDNWHAVGIECNGGLYAVESLCQRKPPKYMRTFNCSQTVHLNPYGGTICREGRPANNPKLLRCGRP